MPLDPETAETPNDEQLPAEPDADADSDADGEGTDDDSDDGTGEEPDDE
jgi:hypothetical protein